VLAVGFGVVDISVAFVVTIVVCFGVGAIVDMVVFDGWFVVDCIVDIVGFTLDEVCIVDLTGFGGTNIINNETSCFNDATNSTKTSYNKISIYNETDGFHDATQFVGLGKMLVVLVWAGR
jgi:hypothetical protein